MNFLIGVMELLGIIWKQGENIVDRAVLISRVAASMLDTLLLIGAVSGAIPCLRSSDERRLIGM